MALGHALIRAACPYLCPARARRAACPSGVMANEVMRLFSMAGINHSSVQLELKRKPIQSQPKPKPEGGLRIRRVGVCYSCSVWSNPG